MTSRQFRCHPETIQAMVAVNKNISFMLKIRRWREWLACHHAIIFSSFEYLCIQISCDESLPKLWYILGHISWCCQQIDSTEKNFKMSVLFLTAILWMRRFLHVWTNLLWQDHELCLPHLWGWKDLCHGWWIRKYSTIFFFYSKCFNNGITWQPTSSHNYWIQD